MKTVEEYEYKGYMSDAALKFFGDKLISEERDGCAVVGHFLKLSNGSIHMPSRHDKFEKYEDGNITLKTE